MEWSWTYLAILSLAFYSCHSKSAQNEMDRRTLFEELEKFNNLTWRYTEEYNKDLGNLIVANILQDLIDSNVTGHQSFKQYCPNRAGVFQIKLNDLEPFPVLCDSKIAGPGWMVILKRFDGSTNFFRDWAQYQNGFGALTSEFFIGLDKLHAITNEKPHELYVFLEDFEGNTRFAKYEEFLIGNVDSYYKMEKLGNYFGDAGDGLSYVSGMRFYTYDQDNKFKCASARVSAGWFNACMKTNCFGLYANF